MKLLLVYPPFCTPASPPYSIANIRSFLKANSFCPEALDLNLLFHMKRFVRFKDYSQGLKAGYDPAEYLRVSLEFREESKAAYSESNKRVIAGEKPELFDELFDMILERKPDVVAFSVVYSSQAFFALSLITALKMSGVKTIVGGPAVNQAVIAAADHYCEDKVALYNLLSGNEFSGSDECVIDYDIFPLADYFVPEVVLPLKTSNTCYYKQCTYCTHYDKNKYREYDLEVIRESVKAAPAKRFFLVDEMIPKARLLELARIFAPLGITWTCQLRPTRELDYDTLKTLRESGLVMMMWGVESGNDRILGLIRKGTNVKDVSQVLSDSRKAGIKNVAYIIFGFPSETKEEFLDTIEFLKKNSDCIDLVSTSIFGLQKGTPIFKDPASYGIKNIVLSERTVLEPKITYETDGGLSAEDAKTFRKKYKKTLEKLDKYPKTMNFWREHMLCMIK
ncbi:radical SAM protein [Candidatus Woesearchaeota archaeon]|nr:radical SAM protein [Candidatus Woesearchaeota archaeon]